jgi:hypothetical protein
MSDIVFLRAWTQVEVPHFYNPLSTALQPRAQTWQGMKTVAELRREHNLPIPINKDSLYKVRTDVRPLFCPFILAQKHCFGIAFFIFCYFINYIFCINSQLKGSQRRTTPWWFPSNCGQLSHLHQSPRMYLVGNGHFLKIEDRLLSWSPTSEKSMLLFNIFS